MIGISAAYLVVAWIAFSLRVVVKGYIMRSFTLDDWLMVVAMVCTEDENLGFVELTRSPAHIHSRQQSSHCHRTRSQGC
jgi:hypothetical protein